MAAEERAEEPNVATDVSVGPCPNCASGRCVLQADQERAFCEECGRVFDPSRTQPASVSGGDESESSPERMNSNPSVVGKADTLPVTNATEQRLVDALRFLEQLSDELDVASEAMVEAAKVFGEMMKVGGTRGRRMESVVAASLHVALRERSEPIPAPIIAKQVEADSTRLRTLSRDVVSRTERDFVLSHPEDFLTYLVAQVGCDEQAASKSVKILQSMDQNAFASGRNPVGFAAAALYLGSDAQVTQRELAEAAGITTETIRVRLRDLRDGLRNGDER